MFLFWWVWQCAVAASAKGGGWLVFPVFAGVVRWGWGEGPFFAGDDGGGWALAADLAWVEGVSAVHGVCSFGVVGCAYKHENSAQWRAIRVVG